MKNQEEPEPSVVYQDHSSNTMCLEVHEFVWFTNEAVGRITLAGATVMLGSEGGTKRGVLSGAPVVHPEPFQTLGTSNGIDESGCRTPRNLDFGSRNWNSGMLLGGVSYI